MIFPSSFPILFRNLSVLSPFRICNFEFLLNSYSSVSVVAGLAGFRRIYSNSRSFAGWRFQVVAVLGRHLSGNSGQVQSTDFITIMKKHHYYLKQCKQPHTAAIHLTFRYTFMLNIYLKLCSRERFL